MLSFFDKYKSFASRINAAMDAGDYKLLQILLGPKYCQLWQYWAAHSVISYNMLSIVKAGDCNLSIKVATKQQKLLEEQKKLLNQKRELLRSGRKEEVEGIKKKSGSGNSIVGNNTG